MSDHYHYTFDFALRRDTDPALIAVLQAVNDGLPPDAADLAALPPVVAMYLTNRNPAEGFGASDRTIRLGRSGIVWRTEKPEDPLWNFHGEWLFHDDEFAMAGIYFVLWLYRQIAGQGHVGTRRTLFDAPPDIITRIGDDIVTTSLCYNPEEYRPLDYRQGPLDAERPVTLGKTERLPLSSIPDDIALQADDMENFE